MEEEKNIKHGKPWDVAAIFSTYNEADEFRNEKMSLWQEEEKNGMQIKVKLRRNDNKFIVKIRLHPDYEPKLKEGKKRGKRKSRKSRKGDTKKGKSQNSTASL